MDYKKIKGLTLVESIVALGVGGAITIGVIQNNIDETESKIVGQTLREAAKIIYAVDHRIAIDGYDPSRWGGKLSWNNKEEIASDLVANKLTYYKAKECANGDWKPRMSLANDARLIDCEMWSESKDNGLGFSADFILDDLGYIRDFELLIDFESEKALSDNIKEIKKALFEIRSDNSKESSGIHNFNFVKKGTNEEISTIECVGDFNQCSLKMSMNRSGSYEYLTLFGDQSMSDNSQLTFIEGTETGTREPLKCLHWKNNKDNKLNSSLWKSDTVNCGIGVYVDNNDSLNPTKSIAVLATTGNFENIVLDKECKDLTWNSGDVVEDGDSPCGILSDGSVIQVIDNAIANTGLFENLYVKDAYFKDVVVKNLNDVNYAEINNLTTTNVTARETLVNTLLEVNGNTEVFDSVFGENVSITMNNAIFENGASFNSGSNIEIGGDLNIDGDVELTKTLSLKDTIIKNNLTVKGNSTISGTMTLNNGTGLSNLISDTNIVGNSIEKINNSVTISGKSLMTAPIGEFGNYNAEFASIRSKIDNMNSIGGSSIVGQDIITVIPGNWVNAGSLTNCDAWTPDPATITKGESFEQLRFCDQRQERSVYTYKNGNLQSIAKEYQTVDGSETRMSVGTKEDIICLERPEKNLTKYDSYVYLDGFGYRLSWKGDFVVNGDKYGSYNNWTKVGNYYYKKYGEGKGWQSAGGHGGYTSWGICRSATGLE